jgi:mannose-6-phosphate isomerase-like protein (cupin superfamily)
MHNEVFPKSEDMGTRTWGNEILLALVPGKYTLKRLEVRAGEKGGLQYHHLKDEVGVMISGEMIVRIDDGSGRLIERTVGPGDVMHFTPGLVHQTEAITDVVYIEASTPHFNDRVRVEADYGLQPEDGLPSTSIEEVIER